MTGQPDSPFTVISSRIAWSCPWYAIRQDQIRLPDGSEAVYNVLEKVDAVWIVPVTPTGEIVMIHNYRHTLDEWCWEVPAGGIKPGQTPLQAAQEELREEIGGASDGWHFLLKAATMNGLGTERGHLYLALDVTLGEPHHEAAEVMTVHPLPLDEVLGMARAGAIDDLQSVTALLLAEPLIRAHLAR